MPTFERLSGWDYATWRAADEDPVMRSTMVGMMVLEKSPDWDRLVDRYERASRQVLILRKRLVEGPIGIANPRLVIDPNFDMGFHMRRFRMAEGATWQDMLDEAARESMAAFDRDRPLWKVTLLEGGPGGRAVLISKLHHAIADGQGALALGAALVDINEEGFDLGPMPAAPDTAVLSPRHFAQIMIEDNAEWVVNTATEIVRGAVPALVHALTTPHEAIDQIVGTAASLIRFANSPYSPLSPIMNKRSVNYHFANFDVRFSDLKAAAKREGHTINDAFLAAIALGLANYHKAQGQPVHELHINMPISTRKPGKDAQNAVSIVRFELPTDLPNIADLMDSLSKTVKRLRLEPALDYANQLGEISRFIPREMLAAAAQASDVTASNVPGPPIPIYIAGAKVESIIPCPPPIGAAVFVALLTYNGVACVGMALDDAAITDRELFLQSMRDGFAEVIGKPVSADNPFSGKAPAKRAPAKKAPAKRARAKKG